MENSKMYSLLPMRIQKELKNIINQTNTDFIYSIDSKNLRYIFVTMKGPPNTCYSSGIFKLELFIPFEYPMIPIKIRFLTKIYHPNIDFIGKICLDILKTHWSPALQITSVLLSIQSLLSSPNWNDPLNTIVSEHWKLDKKSCLDEARLYTEKYAI